MVKNCKPFMEELRLKNVDIPCLCTISINVKISNLTILVYQFTVKFYRYFCKCQEANLKLHTKRRRN